MSKINRLSQSPRAMRESTNDPEAYAIGKVQLETSRASEGDRPTTEILSEFQKQDRDGSGWPPAV